MAFDSRWTVEETVKLFRNIEKLTGVKICKPGLKELKDAEVDENYTPKRISKNNPHFQPDQALQLVSNYIDFEAAKSLADHAIPWTTVAAKIKTKSKDACRNRWNTQVHNTIHSADNFSDKAIKKLINGIRDQDVDYEQEIDFDVLETGHTAAENKHQWERLKKLVSSRCLSSVSRVLADLVEYMRANKAAGPRYRLENTADAEEAATTVEAVGQQSLWKLFRQRVKDVK